MFLKLTVTLFNIYLLFFKYIRILYFLWHFILYNIDSTYYVLSSNTNYINMIIKSIKAWKSLMAIFDWIIYYKNQLLGFKHLASFAFANVLYLKIGNITTIRYLILSYKICYQILMYYTYIKYWIYHILQMIFLL